MPTPDVPPPPGPRVFALPDGRIAVALHDPGELEWWLTVGADGRIGHLMGDLGEHALELRPYPAARPR